MIGVDENRENWKAELLAAHPICIFCGGVNKAEDVDHQPPRQLFRNRIGPEGFAFPSCERCNRHTRGLEVFSTIVATLKPLNEEPVDQAAIQKRLSSLARRGLIRKLIPSANQIRRTARQLGINLQPGESTRDLWRKLKLINIPRPIQKACERVLLKQFLALHWKCTGQIVGRNGGVCIHWFSNYDITVRKPATLAAMKLIKLCTLEPEITRARQDLSDQFLFRAAPGVNDPALYYVAFPESVAALGVVFNNLTDADDPLYRRTALRPFTHQQKEITATSPAAR